MGWGVDCQARELCEGWELGRVVRRRRGGRVVVSGGGWSGIVMDGKVVGMGLSQFSQRRREWWDGWDWWLVE